MSHHISLIGERSFFEPQQKRELKMNIKNYNHDNCGDVFKFVHRIESEKGRVTYKGSSYEHTSNLSPSNLKPFIIRDVHKLVKKKYLPEIDFTLHTKKTQDGSEIELTVKTIRETREIGSKDQCFEDSQRQTKLIQEYIQMRISQILWKYNYETFSFFKGEKANHYRKFSQKVVFSEDLDISSSSSKTHSLEKQADAKFEKVA